MMTKSTVLLREVANLPEQYMGTLSLYLKFVGSLTQPFLESNMAARALASLINRFCISLPQIQMSDPHADILYMTHALSSAARLRLYAIFTRHDEKSRSVCLASVHDIFQTASNCDVRKLNCVSSVYGVCPIPSIAFLHSSFRREYGRWPACIFLNKLQEM